MIYKEPSGYFGPLPIDREKSAKARSSCRPVKCLLKCFFSVATFLKRYTNTRYHSQLIPIASTLCSVRAKPRRDSVTATLQRVTTRPYWRIARMLMERRWLHSLILGQSSKKCNRAIVHDCALKMLDIRIRAVLASSYNLRLATQP